MSMKNAFMLMYKYHSNTKFIKTLSLKNSAEKVGMQDSYRDCFFSVTNRVVVL